MRDDQRSRRDFIRSAAAGTLLMGVGGALLRIAGDDRAVKMDDPLQSPVMERSNVVLVPMPDVNGAQYNF